MSVQNLTSPQPLSLTSLWETVSAMLGPDVSVDVHRAAGSASAAVVAPGQLWPERESDDWQNRIHVGVGHTSDPVGTVFTVRAYHPAPDVTFIVDTLIAVVGEVVAAGQVTA